MKKIIALAGLVLLLAGCVNVKNTNIDTLVNDALTSRITKTNTYRKGYSYYLPKGLDVVDSTDYNEVLKDSNYKYYLFVDAISYTNKTNYKYKPSNNSFASRVIEKDNKTGYLEINKTENEKYLIEIMYNYAKIEVMVDYENLNTAVAYAMSVLSSITYNDSVIANLIGEDILNFKEEEFNIFETVSSDSNYLKYEEEYKYVEDDIPDLDLVN